MSFIFWLFIIVVAVAFIGKLIDTYTQGSYDSRDYTEEKDEYDYKYKRKVFLMTKPEHECFDTLVKAVGDKYYIFPQIHLPSLVGHKVYGQNWRGAFSHINRKSIDFVLCDKAYISPVLAIELDDSTHQRYDRHMRDVEVEKILRYAGIPLLRINHFEMRNSANLGALIEKAVAQH